MAQMQSLNEWFAMLRRRAWLVVLVAIIGTLVSLNIALNQPRYFEATAVIQIETPQIGQDVTGQPAGISDAAHRLQLIQQRLMARDNLLKVIDKHALFADAPGLPVEEQILQLRLATRISQISQGMDAWRPGAIPSGLSVTVRLGDAQKAAEVANEFVAAVIQENVLRRIGIAQEKLEFYSTEEAHVLAEMDTVEQTIADFKAANVDSLPENLSSLRMQLASLRDTELEIDRQIIGLESNSSRARASVLEQQTALLEEQKALIRGRISDIEASLAAGPVVEQQYAQLNRDLRELQDRFSVITRNRAEAEMAQVLESRQQSERFEVLETALVPQYPVSPSRKKVALIGIFVSVLAGFALAYAIEVMNPVIRSAAQLERALEISPVVSIPHISTPKERRGRLVAAIGAAVLLIAAIPLVLRWMGERVLPLRLLGN
jgi:tyrosine-protein kinase Etk/Wzc